MNKISVLHVVGTRPVGGIGTVLKQYSKHIDQEQYILSFVFSKTNGNNNFDQFVRKCGARVYALPNFRKHPFSYLLAVISFYLRNRNAIDVVHIHAPNVGLLDALCARLFGTKSIIIHSHSSSSSLSRYKASRNRLLFDLILKTTRHYLACNYSSGKFLYGDRDFTIVRNPISLQDYLPVGDVERNMIRSEIGLSTTDIAAVHIGYFDAIKNQSFLIDVWRKISQTDLGSRYKLFFIGDGADRIKCEELAKKCGLSSRIIFLGYRTDIGRLLNAFDVFLLPSLTEGAPLSVIEAQANGLPCLISNQVPKDIKASSTLKFLDVLSPNAAEEWEKELLKMPKRETSREKICTSMREYDISTVIQNLSNYYQKICSM